MTQPDQKQRQDDATPILERLLTERGVTLEPASSPEPADSED
ncbi:hypothetical protein [Prauserella cavernicola]|nr:hypothetical protein [Prauserella cavernicola]